MNAAVKIIIFLLVNIVGAFVAPVLANIALANSLYPTDPESMEFVTITFWLGGGSWWVWVVCALGSLGYLFFEGRKRFAFLAAPIYGPLLYGIGILLYFN